MTRNIIRLGFPVIGSAALALSVFACSSDKSSGGGNTDAGTGGTNGTATGGATASGGGGTGGTTATGTGGTTDAGPSPYTCEAKPPADPGGTGKVGDACCIIKTENNATAGTCVKASTISDATLRAAYGHDSCAASSDSASDLKCAPTAGAAADAGAIGTYDTCTATLGIGASLEGRCLPKCFVAGQGAAAQLKQDGCKTADVVCAPCYSPIDGTATGACTQAPNDSPKKPKPATYKKCGALKAGGEDPGVCVPAALVTDPAQLAQLKSAFAGDSGVTDLCDTGELCVPLIKAQNQASCFTKCASIQSLPGACVPSYLVPAAKRTFLTGSVGVAPCKASETCAPCTDPTANNAPTGACD
jgi:hypothetical protein